MGYLLSLFAVGFLADRYGAKRMVLAASIAAWVLRGTRNLVHPAGYANPLRALRESAQMAGGKR